MITLRENLGTLGTIIYEAARIDLATDGAWFIPASALNALRRGAVEALDEARTAAYKHQVRQSPREPPAHYPESTLGYSGNVFNKKARVFYETHGVSVIDPAFECQEKKGDVSLMITKHCLRYSFNLCPKQAKSIRANPMILLNGDEKLILRFDCKPCEMHVFGKPKKNSSVQILPC